MTTEETKTSIPPHGTDCLGHFLTLLDGACKRYSVDVYNAQMANIRNNLWLSFVVLSSCAAFFVQANIGESLLSYLKAEQFNPFPLITAVLLSFSVINAVLALLSGIDASTGTNIDEAYDDIDNQLTTFENRGFLTEDVYRLKRTVLYDVYTQMEDAIDRMTTRAFLIRSMASRNKRAIILGITSVLFFLFEQPFL